MKRKFISVDVPPEVYRKIVEKLEERFKKEGDRQAKSSYIRQLIYRDLGLTENAK